MYFLVKCEKPKKNPRCLKKPRKNPGPSGKNPRTQDSIENPKTLGENPRSGNAACIRSVSAIEFKTSTYNTASWPRILDVYTSIYIRPKF